MTQCPQRILDLVAVWVAPQEKMPKVPRWERFRETCRHQDNLQHTHSIGLLAITVLESLRPHVGLIDGWLLSEAFAVHDMGEGELGRDTPFAHKRVELDIAEYVAFRERHANLAGRVRDRLQRAFLLQFALKPHSEVALFPAEAQRVLSDLAKTHRLESLLFTVIEHLDYALYAIEQGVANRHPGIMRDVLGSELPWMQRAQEQIPGFRQEIWTNEIHAWATEVTSELAVA